jgi:uncharacterized PurR-regulated membrane protein YhhQ (DUF165 family)
LLIYIYHEAFWTWKGTQKNVKFYVIIILYFKTTKLHLTFWYIIHIIYMNTQHVKQLQTLDIASLGFEYKMGNHPYIESHILRNISIQKPGNSCYCIL